MKVTEFVCNLRISLEKLFISHFETSVDIAGTSLAAPMDKEHVITFNLLTQLAYTKHKNEMSDVGALVESV